MFVVENTIPKKKLIINTIEKNQSDDEHWEKICKVIGYVSLLFTIVIVVFIISHKYIIEDK